MLVYGDNTPPTFQLTSPSPTSPIAINQADIDNGASIYIQGKVLDDSFGTRDFRQSIKLDPKNEVTNADGTKSYNLTFTITDFARNATEVVITFAVSNTSTLTKDLGRKNLPTIPPSVTLIALLAGFDTANSQSALMVAFDPTLTPVAAIDTTKKK